MAWLACSRSTTTTSFVVTALPNSSHGNLKKRILKRRNVVTFKVNVEEEDESSKQQEHEKESIVTMTDGNVEENLSNTYNFSSSCSLSYDVGVSYTCKLLYVLYYCMNAIASPFVNETHNTLQANVFMDMIDYASP